MDAERHKLLNDVFRLYVFLSFLRRFLRKALTKIDKAMWEIEISYDIKSHVEKNKNNHRKI